MGNLSKLTWSEIYENYANIAKTSVDTFGKFAKTIGEEGLWITLEIDLFLILGDVKKTDEVMWEQRRFIASLFGPEGFLDLIQKNLEIGLPVIGSIKLPNPLKPFVGLLLAYSTAIKKKSTVEGENGQSVEAYAAMEPMDRAFIALVLPSTVRLFMKFLGTILDLG